MRFARCQSFHGYAVAAQAELSATVDNVSAAASTKNSWRDLNGITAAGVSPGQGMARWDGFFLNKEALRAVKRRDHTPRHCLSELFIRVFSNQCSIALTGDSRLPGAKSTELVTTATVQYSNIFGIDWERLVQRCLIRQLPGE